MIDYRLERDREAACAINTDSDRLVSMGEN